VHPAAKSWRLLVSSKIQSLDACARIISRPTAVVARAVAAERGSMASARLGWLGGCIRREHAWERRMDYSAELKCSSYLHASDGRTDWPQANESLDGPPGAR
jgi:hypothetical protein